MSNNNRCYYTFPSNLSEGEKPPVLAEVGGKALSLLETSAAQFPVPPGLVLTVAFFEPWLGQIARTSEWDNFVKAGTGATKEQCDAIKASCKDLALTSFQKKQLDEATAIAFGDTVAKDGLGIVAVRSSSPEEDLAGSSFAGGYDTTLGVTAHTLQEALVASFSSMFDFRIVQYKIQHNMCIDKPRIAIIVQRQIASDISGVGFSINPSNNCYDEVMISANFGLGESVVGGIITPDTYVVDRIEPKIVSKKVAEKSSAIWLKEGKDISGGTRQEKNQDPTKQALSDDKILSVAELVTRVEEYRGGAPVDIEWAYEENELYLLQARPVTAYIPLFPELLTPRGEEKCLYLDVIVMSQGFSDPFSVLGLDIWKRLLMKAKPQFSTEGKDGLIWNIHGREYINLSNFCKTTGGRKQIDTIFRRYDKQMDRALSSIDLDDYEPSLTPAGAKGVLWKQLCQLWTMLPKMIHGLLRGEESMTEYVKGAAEIIEMSQHNEYSTDEAFVDALDSLMDRFDALMPSMGGVVAPMVSRWRLHKMFSKCDGAEDLLISMCMDLNGNPTSEMGHAMVRLASFADVQKTATSEEFIKLKEDGALSDEFMLAYNEYMKNFGCRGMREIDIATPRTYEKEGDFFNTLKRIDVESNQIKNVSLRRQAAYEKLLSMSKEIGKEDQFRHHANIIQRLLGYREHPKYMFVVMVDMLRRRALKIGDQFVTQGRLENTNQIFDLTAEQITLAQQNTDIELLNLVRKNMEPYKAVDHVKTWPLFIDSRGKIIRGVRGAEETEEGTLLGDPISPGVIKGRAKVLHDPFEKPLNSGEILVARFTEPSWTPIFINAAGVIMEVGGPLQHGAIIAREYGIPCVSGVESATTLIKDGDMIEVDGSAGTIKILVSGGQEAQTTENGT